MKFARTHARTHASNRLIENTPLRRSLTLLAVLTLAPAAHAGIVDSPIPAPFTKHVFYASVTFRFDHPKKAVRPKTPRFPREEDGR